MIVAMVDQNFVLVKKFASGGQDRFLYVSVNFRSDLEPWQYSLHFFTGKGKTPIEIGVVNQN
jgi:hypothetical protein